jgi:probable rRNA maturation factor
VLKAERKNNYSVGVLLTGDRNIRKVNKKHLDHDHATDVISFELDQEQGDVLVSVDTARRYAQEHGLPFREEVARYLVHGTLHLLGYDDKKPALKKKMIRRQESILKKVLS